MDNIVFCSYKPYLQICLIRGKDTSFFITFGADCTYSPTDEVELQLLRAYAERTKTSFLIAEGTDPAELKRKYEKLEKQQIQEAEDRVKARLEAEKQRKKDHEFYSLLRMSDTVYR